MTLPAHDFSLPLRALRHKDFLETPSASARAPKFRAVTLDCEMAGIASGEGEAILLGEPVSVPHVYHLEKHTRINRYSNTLSWLRL